MKKLLVAVLLSVLLFTSCGMGWENWKKNVKSDFGGGLEREIVVSNMLTGETVWEYNGVAYIEGESTAGNITIVFYDKNNKTKKADFLGTFYGVHSIEE
jgi:hypothetical protein